MKFNDIGIIISQKKYSENSAIVKVFSQNHGIYRGFVSGAFSRRNQTIFQIGNLISFEWKSRIEDSLGGFYYVDLEKSFASKIMFERLKLNCLTSLFSIIDSCFLEREAYPELFLRVIEFLQKISSEDSQKSDFLQDYIKIELKILKTLGYGIDLSCCAVTESVENLAYVSPRSARAVSRDAAISYENKLLKLPQFLLPKDSQENFLSENENHIFDGLKLSGYFLEKFVFSQNNSRPKSRKSIEDEAIKAFAISN